MIERLRSKAAENILSFEGKYIASSIDAGREAQNWVERFSGQLSRVKNVIVLGVGCGYHLVALQRLRPDIGITAIDCTQEFIDFAKSQHTLELADVRFVCAKSTSELTNSTVIQNALQEFYTVLMYTPAQITNKKLYTDLESLLLGRDNTGFQFLISNRPEIEENLNLNQLTVHSEDLMTIKKLETLCRHKEGSRVTLLIKTLRELVI